MHIDIHTYIHIYIYRGNEEDLRGTKIAPNFGAIFFFWGGGAHFYYKTWLKLRFLPKMLAADRSNATYIYIYAVGSITWPP